MAALPQPRDHRRSGMAEVGSERLRRILDTQRAIAVAGLDPAAVMELICRCTQELTGADGAGVMLPDGDALRYAAATGFMAGRVGQKLAIEGSLAGWSFVNDTVGYTRDTQSDPRVNALSARSRGVRSLVAVPLRHQDGPDALLLVLSERRDGFDEEDVSMLELLSVVLSAALSKAAAYDARQGQVEALGRFRTLFDGASIGIARISADGRALEVNPALEQMLGYSAAELATMSLLDLVHPDDAQRSAARFGELMDGRCDSFQLEQRCRRKDGTETWSQITAVAELGPDRRPQCAVTMMEDITERKLAEQALARQAQLNEHQALHDALTGLANRRHFRDRVGQAVTAARRRRDKAAVLVMDVDRFKEVNEALGHRAGDALLERLGERIREALRESDTVARLGGDEFGVLITDVSSEADVIAVLERIRGALEKPIVVHDLPVAAEMSIGVALFPQHGTDVEVLLQRADVAMYMAKAADGPYAFYDSAADQHDPTRLTLVGELRRAMAQRELVLFYQPKAALPSGEVSSVEALLRWQHPDRGLIFPDAFIPLAQETGLIKPLTLYVIAEALRQIQDWDERGMRLAVAVNLSARNLLDVQFPDDVQRLLDEQRVDPALLEFEITESTMLCDPLRTKAILERLSAIGIRLSIDDFGTGYSSLAYLSGLPVDEIKIDRSFVMNMERDDHNAVIVRSTIDLGRNLGLTVVAEGVETATAWQQLSSFGCGVAQGYFLSRPIPADELAAWLQDYRASAPT